MKTDQSIALLTEIRDLLKHAVYPPTYEAGLQKFLKESQCHGVSNPLVSGTPEGSEPTEMTSELDKHSEYIKKLITAQPVDAIPNHIGRELYDKWGVIDRYDGVIFLTRSGVMYLRKRGFI